MRNKCNILGSSGHKRAAKWRCKIGNLFSTLNLMTSNFSLILIHSLFFMKSNPGKLNECLRNKVAKVVAVQELLTHFQKSHVSRLALKLKLIFIFCDISLGIFSNSVKTLIWTYYFWKNCTGIQQWAPEGSPLQQVLNCYSF